MDLIQALRHRVSCPKVVAPAPEQTQIRDWLQLALSAPDHGKLRPWRFVILEGEQLDRLGDVFVQASLDTNPDLSESACERIRQKPQRAPLMIVAVAETQPDHKVPLGEQISSTACACEHVMLAAHAQGWGIMWRTGAMAHHPRVKQALGFADKDEIVAFLYVGTPATSLRDRETVNIDDYLREMP